MEKYLLFLSCQALRQSTCISAAPIGRIFVKFGIGNFYENVSRDCKFISIRQKYPTLYIQT